MPPDCHTDVALLLPVAAADEDAAGAQLGQAASTVPRSELTSSCGIVLLGAVQCLVVRVVVASSLLDCRISCAAEPFPSQLPQLANFCPFGSFSFTPPRLSCPTL